APETILLIGNKLETNISINPGSPTINVSAGLMPLDTPTFCASAADASFLCGQGSELHRMARAVFAQYPAASLYLAANAVSAGSSATAVLTFATTATADFAVRLVLCDQVLEVPVATGDTPTDIATACAVAINNAADLPYYAQFAAGVLTITAKMAGVRGNSLIVDAYFVASTFSIRITGSSTTSPGDTTGQWTTIGTPVGTEFPLTNGSTGDSIADVITAIASQRYNRIVVASNDDTNMARLVTHLDSLAGVTVGLRQQGLAAVISTLGTATTLATTLNASRLQVGWHYASKIPGPEVAAILAAARLAGDGSVGGILVGESADPAANLDGVQLATVLAQTAALDQPTATEVESALNNGLAVLVPSNARPGFCALARSITSRSQANNVPNFAVIDTEFVTVCDYVADDLQSNLATSYQGFKLGADSANGNPPLSPRVTTPSLVRAYILDRLAGYEARSILRDVTANVSLLVVEADAVVSGRLNCEIPCEPVSGLHIIAGNVRQIASL
ncbi:MAG: phage tail sheath C-terminal domain-containing protein, partial [Verrucomicrobiota bacterium]